VPNAGFRDDIYRLQTGDDAEIAIDDSEDFMFANKVIPGTPGVPCFTGRNTAAQLRIHQHKMRRSLPYSSSFKLDNLLIPRVSRMFWFLT
jgi:hypothetical protein